MKISKIEAEGRIYTVTFKPNCIEKLFGVKENKKDIKIHIVLLLLEEGMYM